MANPSSIFDFVNEDLATFLAKVVSDGTQADVFNTLKVDAPGEEAAATDINVAGGQLLANGVDDFIQSAYAFIRAVATETFVNLTVTNNLSVGNDISMTGASPTLTVGNGTGAPNLIIDSVAFGIGALAWSSSGTEKWSMNSTATDDLTLTKAAGALVMTVAQSDSLVSFVAGLMLNSASPTLTVGDGTGSPVHALNKSAGGNSAFRFRTTGTTDWVFFDDSAEDFLLQKQGAVTVMSISQTTSLVTWSESMSLGSGSPTLTVGDGTGAPILDITRTGASNGQLRFRNGAASSWRITHTTGDDLSFAKLAGVEVMRLRQSDSLALFFDGVSLDSASPTLTVGDGTGSPNLFLNKVGTGASFLEFQSAGVSDWVFVDDGSENLKLRRQGGVEVLALIQATGLASWANSMSLDSASPVLTMGDATGSPAMVIDKSETGASAIVFRKLGSQSWALTNNASEDLVLARAGAVAVLTLTQSSGNATFAADLEIDGALNHDGSTAGFFATTPITKPSITTADAASIITALAALGLVSDDT